MSSEKDFYQNHYDSSYFRDPKINFLDHCAKYGTPSPFVDGRRYFLVEKLLSGKNCESLLELGCGFGENAHYMRKFSNKVVGMDLVLPSWVKAFNNDGLSFIEGNANNPLPFADKSFDVVVGMMVVEHLFSPFDALDEIHRILKPGGVMILNLPLVTSLKNRFRLFFGELPITSNASDWFAERSWDGMHLHYFNWDSIKKLLASTRFTLGQYSAVGAKHQLKTQFLSLLAGEVTFAATANQT